MQMPTTAHLRSSSDILEVVLMALAIGDLEIIHEKWCHPRSKVERSKIIMEMNINWNATSGNLKPSMKASPSLFTHGVFLKTGLKFTKENTL
jgi:hypothetical protein